MLLTTTSRTLATTTSWHRAPVLSRREGCDAGDHAAGAGAALAAADAADAAASFAGFAGKQDDHWCAKPSAQLGHSLTAAEPGNARAACWRADAGAAGATAAAGFAGAALLSHGGLNRATRRPGSKSG